MTISGVAKWGAIIMVSAVGTWVVGAVGGLPFGTMAFVLFALGLWMVMFAATYKLLSWWKPGWFKS